MGEQVGAIKIPLKDPAGPWRGMTLRSSGTPGGFSLIENGYISSDGGEIRTFPGFKCVIDPETQARIDDGSDTTTGYRATHYDARRDVHIPDAGGYYYLESLGAELMKIWTEPTQLHFCEQMGGRWFIVGESDFVREPIAGTLHDWCMVASAAHAGIGHAIDLNLDDTPSALVDEFNSCVNANCPFMVWVSGMTGDLAADLNDKAHIVTAVAGTVLTLSTLSTVAGASAGTNGWVAKVRNNGSTVLAPLTTPVSDDVESLTSWCATELGNPYGAAVTDVHCAHVFNRQRDFGDYIAELQEGNSAMTLTQTRRRQLGIPYRLVPHVAGNRIIMAAPGYGCVFQIPCIIPPNYVFTGAGGASGIEADGNDLYDKPRSLGVPKAVQWEDLEKTPHDGGAPAARLSAHVYEVNHATHPQRSFGGPSASGLVRAGTYQFRFAYKDEATGEVGLWSEPVVMTTDTTGLTGLAYDQGLQFFIYFPGYLMYETGALSILVWRTKKNGTSFYYAGTVPPFSQDILALPSTAYSAKYGLQPDQVNNDYWHHVLYRPEWLTEDQLESMQGVAPPVINEMPMGCKASRTIRGFTMFGGALGNSGSLLHLQQGTLTAQYNLNSVADPHVHPNHDEVVSRHNDISTFTGPIMFKGIETGFGCAKSSIPTSYSGRPVFSRDLLPSGSKMFLLDKVVNTESAISGAAIDTYRKFMPEVRFKVGQPVLVPDYDYTNAIAIGTDAYLVLPRGLLQISEPDNPGVTPDTNITVVSNEAEQDIEGIGDMSGQAIVATKTRTYLVGFSSSPVGAPPSIASDKFGCIAANSMVSYDGGCAWISDRGPVAMEGGINWIGRDIEPLFHGASARYLRDSQGMMRHSWACHDAERGLLYFGVFADRYAADPTNRVTVSYRGTDYNWTTAAAHADADKIQSRFPCDEVLVYSYRVGAWSVWRPPAGLAIQWMTVGVDNEPGGVTRVFFLGSDRRIYAMDDSFGVYGLEPTTNTVSVSGSVTTISATIDGTTRAGSPVAVYSSASSPWSLKATRTIASVDSVAGTITLDAAVAVVPGDKLVTGVRSMAITTTGMTVDGADTKSLRGLHPKYSHYSFLSATGSGTEQPVFVAASSRSMSIRDGAPTEVSTYLSSDLTQTHSWLGTSKASPMPAEKRLGLGSSTGSSHEFTLSFVGAAQVRLQRLAAEFA